MVNCANTNCTQNVQHAFDIRVAKRRKVSKKLLGSPRETLRKELKLLHQMSLAAFSDFSFKAQITKSSLKNSWSQQTFSIA